MNLFAHPQRQRGQRIVVDQHPLHGDGLIKEEQRLGESRREVVPHIPVARQEFDLHTPSLLLAFLRKCPVATPYASGRPDLQDQPVERQACPAPVFSQVLCQNTAVRQSGPGVPACSWWWSASSSFLSLKVQGVAFVGVARAGGRERAPEHSPPFVQPQAASASAGMFWAWALRNSAARLASREALKMALELFSSSSTHVPM